MDLGLDDWDENAEDSEEFGSTFSRQASTRDGLIFLVDCAKSMFTPNSKGEIHFTKIIRAIQNTYQNKVISSEKDLLGVVFFSTEKEQNPNNFKNIYIYQTLDQPSAERILDLEGMRSSSDHDGFKDKIGHSTQFSLADALWMCSSMFSNSTVKLGSKRVMLFTDRDDPHSHEPALKRQAKERAKDFVDLAIELILFPMIVHGARFDYAKFYQNLLLLTDEEVGQLPDPAEKFEELEQRIRSKDFKKRANSQLSFNLGEGLNLAVNIYNLIRVCPKPSKVKLDRNTNEETKTVSKFYLEETAEVLMPSDIKMMTNVAGKKLSFDQDELKQVKKFHNPGLRLLGFKPLANLKAYHYVKPGHFLYPNESVIEGSACIFSALLKRCLARGVFALCSLTPRSYSPPRMVALIPQEEEVDEHKVQISPSGFHIVYLPYADDLRKIAAPKPTIPTADQIEAAKKLVMRLKFKYEPEQFFNPSLQTFWRNIEALALDRDSPEEFDDHTLPINEQMEKRAGDEMKAFCEAVFPDGYSVTAARKRPAGGGEDEGAKRARIEAIDLQTAARAGNLDKLTIPVLKELMNKEGISAKGARKGDLVDAIKKHYKV